MKVDSDTHYAMRLWCIENIPLKNNRRQWRFDLPTEKTGKRRGKPVQQKYGEPYEFSPVFENETDREAFMTRFFSGNHT